MFRIARSLCLFMFAVMLLMPMLVLSGCGGATVQATWAVENRDYHDNVVKSILLPHYKADPNVPNEDKVNVDAVTAEHEANLDEWESTQPQSPFANLFGGGTNTDP